MNNSIKQQHGLLFLLLLVPLLAAAGYVFFVWKWTYSEGERAGFVQKLSKKGFVCKTWEGELSMVSLPGSVAEKFLFTVWNDKVAEDINTNVGKKVALYYEEKIGLPTSCFGETRYYITKVKSLEAPMAAPVAPAAAPAAAPAVVAPAPVIVAPAPAQPVSQLPTPTPPVSVQSSASPSGK
jgi:hypothetical protein